MGKWAKYGKKYCKDWELEPELKNWIRSVAGDESKAACKFCKTKIRAHHSDLVAHAKTEKHKKNSAPFSTTRTLFQAGFCKVSLDNSVKVAEVAVFPRQFSLRRASVRTLRYPTVHYITAMTPKRRRSDSNSGPSGSKTHKRPKKTLTLVEKVELLDKLAGEMSYAACGRLYGMNESTVRYIHKKEKEIRQAVAAGAFTGAKHCHNNVRDNVVIKMERALNIWMEDMNQRNVLLDSIVIREKANHLYNHFHDASGGEGRSTDNPEQLSFSASKGWFENFKRRFSLKNVKLSGKAAELFKPEFAKLCEDKGYWHEPPQQILPHHHHTYYHCRIKEMENTEPYLKKENLTIKTEDDEIKEEIKEEIIEEEEISKEEEIESCEEILSKEDLFNDDDFNHKQQNMAELSSPWPYLDKLFSLKSMRGNLVKFHCLLCRPKTVKVCAYINSPSNLEKHVERMHHHHLPTYTKLCSQAQKQQMPEALEVCTSKQPKLTSLASLRTTSQATVDKLMISFITQGLLPFKTVELPAFKQLLHELQPNCHIMSRTTLCRKMNEAAEVMKQNLIAAMSKVEHIGTTTDCWTARRWSYIGCTAHWIDPKSLQRRSAGLACRRLKGSHSFDVLACAIDEIHSYYRIRDKVLWTTTDNGSNFIKGFKVFGAEDDQTQDNKDTGDPIQELGESCDEELEEIQHHETSAILDMDSSLEYKLPRHHRCACHLLNLVVMSDAVKAESSSEMYKKLSWSAFAKCQALWNKVGCSSLMVETVERECKIQFIQPIQTRWDSVYMAVERVIRILREQGEDAIRNVCVACEVKMLNPVELDFLSEYCSTMKPVARALNILHSENSVYMGWLLPILHSLLAKLQKIEVSLKYCVPLVVAIKAGIHDRFGHMMEDAELISAAILLPKFKTDWTNQDDIIQKGLAYIRTQLDTEPESADVTTSSSDDDDDDFFSSMKLSHRAPGNGELDGYLGNSSRAMDLLHSFPSIMKLSVQLNTPLPASAVCERLFSCDGLIFSPKCAVVGNKNFENQLLLKLNGKFW